MHTVLLYLTFNLIYLWDLEKVIVLAVVELASSRKRKVGLRMKVNGPVLT